MTATRDPDRLIQAFLDEGPAVMTDRVLDAIREDVDAIDQRAGSGPWRNIPMIRPILVTAAVVAAIAAGLVAYSTFGPNISSQPTPQPTPMPTAAEFPFDGPLEAGTTYRIAGFGEPVTFTVPASLTETDILGDITDIQRFRVDLWEYGIATFYDEVLVVDDICNPTATIPLPASPDEVLAWLNRSTGALVTSQNATVVDGRVAHMFDVMLTPDCVREADSSIHGAFQFQAGERHRIYAIPTGDDMILGVTWGTDFQGRGEQFLDTANAAFNALVRSMTFD